MKMDIQGLKELDKQLGLLTKSAGKGVLRKVLKAAALPIVEAAKAAAPVEEGDLRDSITATTKLSKAQKKLQNKSNKENGKASAEIYIGPTIGDAHRIEFGTAPHLNGGKFAGSHHPGTSPQPFLRPAFEGQLDNTIEIIKTELAAEIGKALKRQAKKAAKGR